MEYQDKRAKYFFTCCDRLFPLGGDIDQGFPPPARATTCSIFSSVERFKLHSSFCLGCRETTTHTYTHSHIYIKYTRRCEFCPIQSRQQISHLLLISVKVAFPLKIKCVSWLILANGLYKIHLINVCCDHVAEKALKTDTMHTTPNTFLFYHPKTEHGNLNSLHWYSLGYISNEMASELFTRGCFFIFWRGGNLS